MDLRRGLRERILVCDGAMGTMLHAAGNSLDQALPALNLTKAPLVRAIHDSYVEAGVDIVQTNTFGAGRLRLSAYGLGDQVEEINRAGVRLARQAAEQPDRPVLVAGSVAPAVSVQQRRRVDPAERRAALREQVEVLADAGVDLLLLETFGHLDELVEAVEAAADVGGVPVVAQATFADDTRTLSGHSPREVALALSGAPIAALGVNCTLGPQRSLAVLRALGEHTDLPLTAQPNAGLPRRVAPARFEYDIDAEYFVKYARRLLDAGVRIVGGCCGTTPTQIAAIVPVAERYRDAADARRAEPPRPAAEPSARPVAAPEPFVEPGEFIVELEPPTDGGVEAVLEVARRLADSGVRLVSVAASRSAKAQARPIDLALHLRQVPGIDTMATVTTWDRTIMALQADLLGAHTLGVRRVVCETGTPPLLGDYPHVDGVWDVDSLGLIELLAGLNNGGDYYGLPLPAKTEFEIGARVNPGSRELDREAELAIRKIEAGAQFLVTRPVYDAADLERLLDRIGQRVPVLASIRPLTGFPEAELLAHEVPDVHIPARTLDALLDAGDRGAEVGVELALDLVARIGGMANGIVLSPGRNPVETVRHILTAV